MELNYWVIATGILFYVAYKAERRGSPMWAMFWLVMGLISGTNA